MSSARSARVTARRSPSPRSPPSSASMAASMRSGSAAAPPWRRIRARADARNRFLAGSRQFRADDHPPRRGDPQAIGERRAAEVGVDESDDGADLRQAEPDGEIFRPIGHHEGDRFALADAGGQSPARDLIDATGESAKIEALALAEQRRPLAIAARPFAHRARQNALEIAGRAGRRLERARPGLRRRRGVPPRRARWRERIHASVS